MKRKTLNDIVAPLLGLPYKLNGDINKPKEGIDCFGMIRIIMYGLHGVIVENASQMQYALYNDSPRLALHLISHCLKGFVTPSSMHFVVAGDIVGEANTVGVYTGNGNFLCAVTNDKVQVLPVKAYHFYKVYKWADQ